MNKLNFSELEEKIGYSFKDKDLLFQALRHSSYINEQKMNRIACNERLEFLGDAVLELISSEFLFKKHKKSQEGELTKLRSGLVCEMALAYCAREFGLPNFILLGKGEDRTGGRERDSIVSDACEALIGAIFLDGGIDEAKKFILTFILNDDEGKTMFYDSKSILQEIVQKENIPAPSYRIVDEQGPAHSRVFVAQVIIKDIVFGEGSGRTKKHAEQQASYQAILKIKAAGKICI